MTTSFVILTVHMLIEVALVVRVILRPHRDPASRIAWRWGLSWKALRVSSWHEPQIFSILPTVGGAAP